MAEAARPAAPAAKAAPAPAPKKDEAEELKRENAQLRERLARAEAASKLERRTTDATSPDYDAELAIEETWPGTVRN